jgi:hypothetical protein
MAARAALLVSSRADARRPSVGQRVTHRVVWLDVELDLHAEQQEQ